MLLLPNCTSVIFFQPEGQRGNIFFCHGMNLTSTTLLLLGGSTSLFLNVSSAIFLLLAILFSILRSTSHKNKAIVCFSVWPCFLLYYVPSAQQCRKNVTIHTVGQKILKSPGKKLMKSNKTISWNCVFGSFKLFSSSKIDFCWPFLKLQKMGFS